MSLRATCCSHVFTSMSLLCSSFFSYPEARGGLQNSVWALCRCFKPAFPGIEVRFVELMPQAVQRPTRSAPFVWQSWPHSRRRLVGSPQCSGFPCQFIPVACVLRVAAPWCDSLGPGRLCVACLAAIFSTRAASRLISITRPPLHRTLDANLFPGCCGETSQGVTASFVLHCLAPQ